jgi:hypothetical protein
LISFIKIWLPPQWSGVGGKVPERETF